MSTKTTKSVVSSGSSSHVLSELLILPQPQPKKTTRRKKGVNSKTVCITDQEVFEELKVIETLKLEKERKREERKKTKLLKQGTKSSSKIRSQHHKLKKKRSI